CQQHNTSPWTF
nr:immunoglobulin light chain junction region [Macaca mulatta]